MNIIKYNTSPAQFPRKKILVPIDFFQSKKLLKALRYQLKMLKVYFELRFGLCKENACIHESLGYQYEWQKLLEQKR
jgi:hypothetical protein